MDYPTLPIGFHWAPLRGVLVFYCDEIRLPSWHTKNVHSVRSPTQLARSAPCPAARQHPPALFAGAVLELGSGAQGFQAKHLPWGPRWKEELQVEEQSDLPWKASERSMKRGHDAPSQTSEGRRHQNAQKRDLP